MAANRNRNKRNRSDGSNRPTEIKAERNEVGILANRLAGTGSNSIYQRLLRGCAYVDFETDMANFKTNVLDLLAMYLVTDNTIDKWNATQVENYENLIVYGSQLLVEMKNQYTQLSYVPTLTRSDATAGSSFTRASLLAFSMEVAQEIKIPPVCYAIAELYTAVLELREMSYYEGRPGAYFMPFRPNKTLTQMETLLTTITGCYDAVVYASQSGARLVPVDLSWVRHITEVPFLSWYGNLLANFYPINYDNGGAETESYTEVDETTDIYWNEKLGVPEYFDALALYRSASCADSPKFLTVDSIANDKISVGYADINSTSFTEFPKSYTGLHEFNNVQAAMSLAEPTVFHNNVTFYPFPNRQNQANVVASPAAWNLLASMWLKRHFSDMSVKHLALSDIGRDLTASILRRSGIGSSSSPGIPPGSTGTFPGMTPEQSGQYADALKKLNSSTYWWSGQT